MQHKFLFIQWDKENESNKVEQYNGIDLFKFLMAVFVVAIHMNPFEDINAYMNYGLTNYIARIAVPFYFMCTGYFVFRKVKTDSINTHIIKKFVFKILRLYLLWTILYIPMIYNDVILKGNKAEIWNVITNGYGHLWYLPAIIVAVSLLFFLLYKKVSLKYIVIFAGILYCIGVFGQSYFGILRFLFQDTIVWNLLNVYRNVFITTRNGIFFGFAFVTIGALFSIIRFKMNLKFAFIGFCASFILLGFEVFITKYLNLVFESNMFFLLIPTLYFLFYILLNYNPVGNERYVHLRYIGMLVFYNHLLVNYMYRMIIMMITILTGIQYRSSVMKFCFDLVVSIILAEIIIRLSNRVKWLKVLYQ